jgi:SpoVK/Ycf46/Vps4 family AAA+-type ATPase
MQFNTEINLLLKAHYPIIYISTFEEERLEYTLYKILKGYNTRSIYCWNFIDGYKGNVTNPKFAAKNPLQALELIENVGFNTPAIFILKDFNKFLFDISISRKVRNLLPVLKTQPKTIIILSAEIEIPKELNELVTILEFGLPNEKEIKYELIRLFKSIKKEYDNEFLEKMIRSCQGLSLEKIRRALSKSIAQFGSINANTIDLILNEKKQIISQTKILEFYNAKNYFKDIGGLENLKNWLKNRKESFSDKARIYGLPAPRGLLLIGIQGTGKSLTAKAIANEWKLPLLKLDIGRLFGGIVGESENRIRQMIQLSEALSPCVLWIDEIDKAFGEQTKSIDGGTTNRVLATFITWLSEKESNVFIVATANNFNMLPLEIIRKGRFDEIFYLGLPNKDEREKIFEVILTRLRPAYKNQFDIKVFSQKSIGFSGAEIEQAIIEGMHLAFNEKREFTNLDIIKGLEYIIPLSKIDSEKLKQSQNFASSGRIRLASEIE